MKTIEEVCDGLKETLLQKNSAYGNSACRIPELVRISPTDAILVRMSDKISRLKSLKQGVEDNGESFNDTILDLAGYCVLYLVADSNELSS